MQKKAASVKADETFIVEKSEDADMPEEEPKQKLNNGKRGNNQGKSPVPEKKMKKAGASVVDDEQPPLEESKNASGKETPKRKSTDGQKEKIQTPPIVMKAKNSKKARK